MTEVIVVHKWKDEQKDQVMKFATTIMDMAKSKKLPAGLKLEEIYFSNKENQAICKWDVDTLDHLMETAKSMNPTWDIQASEVTQKFKKGLF